MLSHGLISTWLCLTLTTAFALGADYHLFQTQMVDGEYTERGAAPTVWVLIQPNGLPLVFQKLDSRMLEAHLRLLPRDTVIHIHASPVLTDPTSPAQWEIFKGLCQKHGIRLIDDSPKD
jgi:hypothetical protein